MNRIAFILNRVLAEKTIHLFEKIHTDPQTIETLLYIHTKNMEN